jgi:hypothetical protein
VANATEGAAPEGCVAMNNVSTGGGVPPLLLLLPPPPPPPHATNNIRADSSAPRTENFDSMEPPGNQGLTLTAC